MINLQIYGIQLIHNYLGTFSISEGANWCGGTSRDDEKFGIPGKKIVAFDIEINLSPEGLAELLHLLNGSCVLEVAATGELAKIHGMFLLRICFSCRQQSGVGHSMRTTRGWTKGQGVSKQQRGNSDR